MYWHAHLCLALQPYFIRCGHKIKDDLRPRHGILFLLINLYTRYFEYFWN